MYIKELSFDEFNRFAQNNIIGNFYQSINYAMLKAEEGYEYEYIGLVDNTPSFATTPVSNHLQPLIL